MYDGYSLFHYFAAKVDVIEMIHDRFRNAIENNILTEKDKNMPLVLLHPDINGSTALDRAIAIERPKSFELMIDMLEPFQNFCLSKMMLESFPHMIQQSTDMIIKFLSSAMYQPVLMEEPIITQWPNDAEEFIFPSHTCMITAKLLKEELKDQFKAEPAGNEEDDND